MIGATLFLAMFVQPEAPPMTMHVQGEVGPVGITSPDDEENWFNFAWELANRRHEAVVVCQGERFICVLNPTNR